MNFARTLAGLLAALVIATAERAKAQDRTRDIVPAASFVYQMDRPYYDFLGMRMESFLLRPSFSETIGYDDNIFASDSRRAGDLVSTTAESLSLSSNWSHNSISGNVFFDQQLYAHHSGENANTYGADGAARLDLPSDSSLELDAGFVQQPVKRGQAEDTRNGAARAIYNAATGALTFNRHHERWVERAQVSVRKVAYVASRNASRSATKKEARGRVGYDLTGKINLFVEGAYSEQHWLRRSALRDYHLLTGLAGLHLEVPGVADGEIAAGFLRQDFTNNSFATLFAPAIRADLTWDVLPLTSIFINADRTITGTETFCDARAGVCENAIGSSQSAASSATLRDRRNTLEATVAQTGVQHEIWHDLLGEVRLRYERDKFAFNHLTDDTYGVAVGARFLVNRNLEFDLEYAHNARVSNHPSDRTFNSGPFGENVVSLTLKAGL